MERRKWWTDELKPHFNLAQAAQTLDRLLKENDLASVAPDIAAEWHPTKNSADPQHISRGSSKQAWWQCSSCGYEWKAVISSRTVGGRGCPACAGKVVTERNRLSVCYPQVAAEWHPSKNGSLTAAEVSYGSHRKAWWLCGAGHEYVAVVYNRTVGESGCPHGLGRVSMDAIRIWAYLGAHFDLLDIHEGELAVSSSSRDHHVPDIVLSEHRIAIDIDGECWHKSENAQVRDAKKIQSLALDGWSLVRVRENPLPLLDADSIGCESLKDPAAVAQVITDYLTARGIPRRPAPEGYDATTRAAQEITRRVCGISPENSLGYAFPVLAAEWHPDKNGLLGPNHVAAHSNRVVWWQCVQAHEWQAKIKDRSGGGNGCPHCSGRRVWRGEKSLATERPELVRHWNWQRNGSLTPWNLSVSSGVRVWWRCKRGHVWESRVADHTGSSGACPKCVAVARKDTASPRLF